MGRPTNALIVDDEPHVRTFLRLLLREVGIAETWEAPNGADALAMYERHQPQLVLLDVNMPVMSGIETLTQLKQRQPALPVIMVSSQNAMSTVLEALRLGAAAYVIKQSPKEEALTTLRDTLDELAEESEG